MALRGVIDTGAARSAIDYRLAEQLGLGVVDALYVEGATGAGDVLPVYEASLRLHTTRASFTQTVVGLDGGCQFDMLIGRDLISKVRLRVEMAHGYFSATGPGPRGLAHPGAVRGAPHLKGPETNIARAHSPIHRPAGRADSRRR